MYREKTWYTHTHTHTQGLVFSAVSHIHWGSWDVSFTDKGDYYTKSCFSDRHISYYLFISFSVL